MKNLGGILFGGLILLGLAGCRETLPEYSDFKNKEAKVVEKGGLGIRINPNYIAFKAGKMYFKFNEADDDLTGCEKLKVGDWVNLTYEEVSNVTRDDTNYSGQKVILERKLAGYKFLDAKIITNKK